MYCSSVLFFLCYLPEFYANYKNKNGNIYNVPEKIIILIATSFAFSYSLINNSPELIVNYGPLLFLDIISLSMRLYYSYINHCTNIGTLANIEIEIEIEEIPQIENKNNMEEP
jgi:uncharacterized protein with PQ loop repeat